MDYLYNNRFSDTRGWIKMSAAYLDKGSGNLIQKSLGEGLGLPYNGFVDLQRLRYTFGIYPLVLWSCGKKVLSLNCTRISITRLWIFDLWKEVNGEW